MVVRQAIRLGRSDCLAAAIACEIATGSWPSMRLANRTRPTSEEGQDLLEYGLLAALIALVAFGAIASVGETIYTVFWKTIETAF